MEGGKAGVRELHVYREGGSFSSCTTAVPASLTSRLSLPAEIEV